MRACVPACHMPCKLLLVPTCAEQRHSLSEARVDAQGVAKQGNVGGHTCRHMSGRVSRAVEGSSCLLEKLLDLVVTELLEKLCTS